MANAQSIKDNAYINKIIQEKNEKKRNDILDKLNTRTHNELMEMIADLILKVEVLESKESKNNRY